MWGAGPQGHVSVPLTTPRPEDSALAVLDAYSRAHGLTIVAYRGVWTVTGGGLEEPARIDSYNGLVIWLSRTFGTKTAGTPGTRHRETK